MSIVRMLLSHKEMKICNRSNMNNLESVCAMSVEQRQIFYANSLLSVLENKNSSVIKMKVTRI